MSTRKQNKEKITGSTIIVKDGNIEGALKIFKSVVYNSGKLKEVYDRQFYIKPSLQRRRILLKAIYAQKIKTEIDKNI